MGRLTCPTAGFSYLSCPGVCPTLRVLPTLYFLSLHLPRRPHSVSYRPSILFPPPTPSVPAGLEPWAAPLKSMAQSLLLKPKDGFSVLWKYLMILAGWATPNTGPITADQSKGPKLRGQTERKTRDFQNESQLSVTWVIQTSPCICWWAGSCSGKCVFIAKSQE